MRLRHGLVLLRYFTQRSVILDPSGQGHFETFGSRYLAYLPSKSFLAILTLYIRGHNEQHFGDDFLQFHDAMETISST